MGLEIINELKKKKGLTSEQLSKESGVPLGTLNKILNGTTKDPKLETLKALAKVLGCTLDDFNDFDENRKKEKEHSEAINTIAAHFEGKKITPKKMKLIEQYIDALFEDDEDWYLTWIYKWVMELTYDELLSTYDNVVKIKEDNFYKNDLLKDFKGLYKNGKIAINSELKINEKICVLAEELGHHFTSSGNILNIEDIGNIKQEKRARNWAYEQLVKITELISAFNKGVVDRYELAEYLNVTEEFLEEAIQHYREKYGLCYETDDYIIYFEPSLGILKLF